MTSAAGAVRVSGAPGTASTAGTAGGPPAAGPRAAPPVLPAREVVDWYREHARRLPWREPGTTPYGVLVSEVMSQQTPVARVVPAWRQWMGRWPDPAALAGAEAGEVLRVWGRLGYPRRALRLMECARAVVERHGGRLPCDLGALRALPGIGDYTAGAVMAFAYGRRALTLDTNVRRVLARAAGGRALPPPAPVRSERERAEALLPGPDAEAAAWSVAVMELGALVCTAREPRCDDCPWREECAWLAAGSPPDEHARRRRRQAWRGTDRQARGLIMARLRGADTGATLSAEALLTAGAGAGARAGRAADREQPGRALASLLADGLIATDDGGTTFRLP